jgi:hypothetical protein
LAVLPRVFAGDDGALPGRHGLSVATVVIELPGGEGIIRLDDGKIELTHDVTLERGQPLQPWDRYQTLRMWLSDERMLFGGLLPPGAVSVEAVEATDVRKPAAVGGGAYVVIVEDGQHGRAGPGLPQLRWRVRSPVDAGRLPASARQRRRGTVPCVRGGRVRRVLPD